MTRTQSNATAIGAGPEGTMNSPRMLPVHGSDPANGCVNEMPHASRGGHEHFTVSAMASYGEPDLGYTTEPATVGQSA